LNKARCSGQDRTGFLPNIAIFASDCNIPEMNCKWIYLLLLIAALRGCMNQDTYEHQVVKIDPYTEYQRIHGFGTSMVNYKEFPAEYFQEDFLDMIVNDLGMSILRIPITEHLEYRNDDDDPDHYAWENFYLSDNNCRRGMEETFRFVGELKKRGVDLFMASPWSPPQYMKTNRAPIQGGFLRADMYEEFAEYLSAYIMLAKINWDVDIRWISLQNESIFIEFYRSCLYHGYGMKEALKAIMDKFERENIETRLLINEDMLFPERVYDFLDPVFSDPVSSKYPGDIAVHRHASGNELLQWKDLASAYGREYHMTETSGHQTTWDGAMAMAVDMHEYLVLGNFSSWIYWQISGNTGGSNPGLYTLMLEGKPTPKYYAAKHFYRNIRPGAIRVEASCEDDSILISAYKHPATGDLTLVLINPSQKQRVIRLEKNTGLPARFDVQLSDEKVFYQDKGNIRTGDLIHIPARSIMSLTGNRRDLKDPGKVLEYKESWTPGTGMPVKAGNLDPFPIKSEWQGATDRHAGRYIQVESAIQAGTINQQRADGWTLLHESILNGDGEAVNLLINNGADVNLAAKDGWTPLHAASSGFVGNRGIQVKYKEYNHYEIFRILLDSGADINARTEDGWTPLHCAVINAYTGYRQSESTSLNRIKDLITAGADLEARDENGRTPLHWAAMQGYSHFINEQTRVEDDVVRILLNSGAEVNAIDQFGSTPLHYAVQMGFESITWALMQGGANTTVKNLNNLTPMDIALELQSDTLQTILRDISPGQANKWRPKSFMHPDTLDLDQALVLAAISGDEKQLIRLLKEGADVRYRDTDGFRAIERALDNGFESIVKLLKEAESSN